MTNPAAPTQKPHHPVLTALISAPVLAALISAAAIIISVTIPLIFVKVDKVHTLVNAKSTTQDSTIQVLQGTITRQDSTISSLVETTRSVRAAMDTLRQLDRRPP